MSRRRDGGFPHVSPEGATHDDTVRDACDDAFDVAARNALSPR